MAVKPLVMAKLALDARCVDARLADRIAREKGLNVAAMQRGLVDVIG